MSRGVPNRLMEGNNRARAISSSQLPTADEAVQMYQTDGGRLSDPVLFGSDPLSGERVDMRDQAFQRRYTSFSRIFHTLVNGDSVLFKQALLFLIDITTRLSV